MQRLEDLSDTTSTETVTDVETVTADTPFAYSHPHSADEELSAKYVPCPSQGQAWHSHSVWFTPTPFSSVFPEHLEVARTKGQN